MFLRTIGLIAWSTICVLTGAVAGAIGVAALIPDNTFKAAADNLAEKSSNKLFSEN